MKKELFHKSKMGLAALAILALCAASSLGPGEALAQQAAAAHCGCMDVVLVVDDTGSMGPAINNVKLGLDDIVNAAKEGSGGDLRMGLVSFKDFIEVDQPLTANITDVENAITALSAPTVHEVGTIGAGAGEPEASDEAVRYVATGSTLDPTGTVLTPKGPLGAFRANCAKIIVLVTDATPGGFDDFFNEGPPEGYEGFWWDPPYDDVNAKEAANLAAAAGVKIASVLLDNDSIITWSHPDGVEPDVMMAYADTTGGTFVTVPADGTGIAAAITSIIQSCGTVLTTFLVIDEDSIDNGNPPNFFKAGDVNDNIAAIGLRVPLPVFSGANVGTTKILYTGEVADEGWFALKTIPLSWNTAGPTTDGLTNFLVAGPGLGSETSPPDKLLDKVPGVTPLREIGLMSLIGRSVCAVVYDSDISINYGKTVTGNLMGANLGIVAFKVLNMTPLSGGSSSSLPQAEIEILDPTTTCTGPLALYVELPDLRVSALSAPSSALPGSAITVTDTTKNFGAVPAAPSTTSVYFSLDSTLDPGDTLIAERSAGALGAGISSSGSTTFTIPAGTAPGTCYLIAVADASQAVAEAIENNNTMTTSIAIALPDLQVSALSAPSSAAAGSAITVTDTTKNFATTVSAGASTTFVYFSLDNILDSGDTLIGNRSVGALGAGNSSSGSTTFTIPASTPGGTRYLIALADGPETVAESIETNNARTRSITVVVPDLQVSALSAPSSAVPGSTVTVTDTTRNYGTVPAVASATFFYFSLDNILDPGDTLLGSRSVGALGTGASSSSSGSTTVTIPAGATPGTRYLIAMADGGQALAETSETNNTRTASIAIGPDLQVSALSAPSSAAFGSTITVSDTTKNFGTAPAAASTTSVYFSLDNILDPGDTLIGNRSVAALGAGSSSSGSMTFTIPVGTAGTRYLIALADSGQTVAESIETNNTRTRSITIQAPDLQVETLSAPSSAAAGSAITVKETTKNYGTASAPASTTFFYFSLDSVLDPGDTLLGSRSVGALSSGSNTTGETTVTIPAGATPGTRYLIARADGGNAVAEADEGNNTRNFTITVK